MILNNFSNMIFTSHSRIRTWNLTNFMRNIFNTKQPFSYGKYFICYSLKCILKALLSCISCHIYSCFVNLIETLINSRKNKMQSTIILSNGYLQLKVLLYNVPVTILWPCRGHNVPCLHWNKDAKKRLI